MSGPTDLVMIWALISSKRLSRSEEKVFQNMYDDLQGGRLVSLSKNQRMWAEKKYTDLNLQGKPLPPPPPPKVRHDSKVTMPWEGKLPLKPPGKG